MGPGPLMIVSDDETLKPFYDTTEIQRAYVGLLRLTDIRHRFQPELCALRDWIALHSRREPQDVQDECELIAATETKE